MDIQIIEKEEMKVIGISWNGSYSQVNKIPRLLEEFEIRSLEINDQIDENIMIAPFHSRETELTYYVTKSVEKISHIPDGMVGFTIPAKNYVYATYCGSPKEVDDTYLKIYSWMKEYGYEQDHQALSLEVYEKDFRQVTPSGIQLFFDIYIPVKKY